MNRWQKAAAVWNKIQVEHFIRTYNENPVICKYCGKSIDLNGKKPSQVRLKKFCDSSCAAKFNNTGRVLSEETRDKIRKGRNTEVKICSKCGANFRSTIGLGLTLCVKCRRLKSEYGTSNNFKRYDKCCDQCGTTFVTMSKTQKFCSHSCSGKRSSESQNKRSKNEVYFAELCQQYYGNVLTNEPIFNGWDADVILPDLKVAVLWNGNWHHKKLTYKHSLGAVQNRDKIKMKEITNAGYQVYIIDDFGKYNQVFVQNKFEEFKTNIAG